MNWPKNRPAVVTLTLIVSVVAHALLTIVVPAAAIWTPLTDATVRDSVAGLYVGLAGVSAMAAGFAGVVIIFGLDSRSEKFLTFRQTAGHSLSANWISVIASSFGSAGAGVAAAVLLLLGHPGVAPWLFELGVLLVVHAALRMLWLLRSLMRVVAADDGRTTRAQARAPLARVFGNRSAG
jgi:hypothetical protein